MVFSRGSTFRDFARNGSTVGGGFPTMAADIRMMGMADHAGVVGIAVAGQAPD